MCPKGIDLHQQCHNAPRRLNCSQLLDFLNRFVADVTELIVAQRGTIH